MHRITCAIVGALLALSGPAAAHDLELLPLGRADRAYEAASATAGTVYDAATGTPVTLEELAAELVQSRVVLLGESHTDMAQKEFHGALFAAMAELEPNLVLGMEFFLRSDDEALAAWSAGAIDEAELLRRTQWYERGTYNFGYYRPVMEVARERGLRVVGLNVPRSIPRAVNRGGLDSLDDEQRAEVGEIVVGDSPQHRYLISRYFGETVALLPPGWFDNMYAAQCLWDVVMARSILDNLGPEETMVVIVGSGHVAYGLGIPQRIQEELAAGGGAEMAVLTFCPVTAPPPPKDDDPEGHPMGGHGHGMGAPTEKPAQFTRSLADFVGVFPDTGGIEAYPTVGLSLKEVDGAPVVSMAWPDTLAESVEFASGDRIVDVNGVQPGNLTDLRMMLSEIRWGQRLGFTVEREGVRQEIAVLLFPTVDLTESDTAPGWTVEPVLEFESGDARPVASVDKATVSRTALVTGEDGSRRVEVHVGEVLEEVHELDAGGVVIRSLYRVAREDGSVEFRYQRNDAGVVTATKRFDRTGGKILDLRP
jgi:uncharacterized iron-regulated protein